MYSFRSGLGKISIFVTVVIVFFFLFSKCNKEHPLQPPPDNATDSIFRECLTGFSASLIDLQGHIGVRGHGGLVNISTRPIDLDYHPVFVFFTDDDSIAGTIILRLNGRFFSSQGKEVVSVAPSEILSVATEVAQLPDSLQSLYYGVAWARFTSKYSMLLEKDKAIIFFHRLF